jgi:hypothetical protein
MHRLNKSSDSANPDKINGHEAQLVKQVSDEVAAALHDNLVAFGELSAWLCAHYRPGDGSLDIRGTSYFALEAARVVLMSNMAALEMLCAWIREHADAQEDIATMVGAAERALAKSKATLRMER